MRKVLLIGSLVAALVFGVALGAHGSDGTHKTLDAVYNHFGVWLTGGKSDRVDTVFEPFLVDGHLYVPARPLAEALGATVRWTGLDVLVTPKTQFITEHPSGGVLFRFPGLNNASILVPGKPWYIAYAGTNVLLDAGTDDNGGTVRIKVLRLDRTGTKLATYAQAFEAILATTEPIQEESHAETTVQEVAALEVRGKMWQQGAYHPVRMRVVDDGTNVWAVVAVGDSAAANQALDSFTPGDGNANLGGFIPGAR